MQNETQTQAVEQTQVVQQTVAAPVVAKTRGRPKGSATTINVSAQEIQSLIEQGVTDFMVGKIWLDTTLAKLNEKAATVAEVAAEPATKEVSETTETVVETELVEA